VDFHGLQSDDLVSIIIVAYDNWPDVELAIQSALCQSYPKIEVIVVNNSSRDATEEQVQRLFGNRIKYVRQPNTGEGGGRNGGMRLTSGEFVQFLDGDDFLAPDKVEKQVAALRAAPDVDAVYGDARQFQSSAGSASWEDWDGRDYPDMLATLLSPDGNGGGLVVHSLLFRRRVLELIGPWAENMPTPEGPVTTNMADQDYWLRAAWSGCRFRYCPGSLCFQRKRSGQLSSDTRNVIRGMESVYLRAYEYITREPYKTFVSRQLARILFYLAVSEEILDSSLSLKKLRKAREVCPDFVTITGFAIGWLLIVTRVGPFVYGRWLTPVRRFAATLAGMKKRG
jgi:glycosyltransferase involved in cell wall biosynthesis